MNKFQLILLSVFGVFILIGVVLFSLGRSGSSNITPTVNVWGYINQSEFKSIMDATELSFDKTLDIVYTQKEKETLVDEYVEALADDVAPDLIFIDHSNLYTQKNRLLTIPYDSYSLRRFQDNFISGAQVFLDSEGVKAVPLSVDPLILYWNKDIFANAGVINPPRYWSEYASSLIPIFTKRNNLTITQTAIPMGTWDNLNASKGIFSTLVMQGGGKITQRGRDGLVATLKSGVSGGIIPTEAALNFFVDFSNPQKNFYTWNRSMPNSQDYFASGKAATYIGYASEIETIRKKNPNLNFDIAVMPQTNNGNELVYGKMNALAISKNSKNVPSVVKVMSAITGGGADLYSEITGETPVRRDLLNSPDGADIFEPIVYKSALISNAWLDPEPRMTDSIFEDMTQSVLSGRKRVSDAVTTAQNEFERLLR